MEYAIINESGLVTGKGEADNFLNAVKSGSAFGTVVMVLPGEAVFPQKTAYIGGDFIGILPKPSRWAEWTGAEWVDPRTAGDMQAALYAAREAASLGKTDLLTSMLMAGLMDQENVLIASEGRIPPMLEPALMALPDEAQVIAQIKWRNDNDISRTNPVILMAAAALNITDAQMDQIFGVQAPT